jgi:hypothetical protein
MSQIESLTNSRIKALVRLRKRSERDRTGTFIIEGERELEAALESKEVIELFIAEDLLTAHGKRVVAQAAEADIPMTTVTPQVLTKVAYRGNPSGFIAVARQWEMLLEAIPLSNALILVVESIEKPGNLGGMLRSAEAAGAAVISVGHVGDDLSRHEDTADRLVGGGHLASTPAAGEPAIGDPPAHGRPAQWAHEPLRPPQPLQELHTRGVIREPLQKRRPHPRIIHPCLRMIDPTGVERLTDVTIT